MSDARTPFAIDDLYELGWVEDAAIGPDGRSVAYVRVTVDRAANRYRRTIWLATPDQSRPRRLSAGPRSDTAPRWSASDCGSSSLPNGLVE